MSKKNKVSMPQSTAGLVRYYDTTKDSIKFKPEHVLAVCAAASAVLIAANLFF